MIDESLKLPTVNYDQLPNDRSVLHAMPLRIGTLYTFNKVGQQLPQHAHEDDAIHFSIILSGKYSISREKETFAATAGDIINFAIAQKHSIACIEPGQILNCVRAGLTLSSIIKDIDTLAAKTKTLGVWFSRFGAEIEALHQ